MSPARPPWLAERLLSLVLVDRHHDFILGDLAEQFQRRAAADGPRSAARWYWRQLRESLLPSARDRLAASRGAATPTAPYGRFPSPRRGTAMIEHLARDFRYAIRTLVKEPLWTTSAVITLALAIGATTAIFSVVNAVLLRPLPFAEPDELVALHLWDPEEQESYEVTSYPIFERWREALDVLSGFEAYATTVATLDRGEGAERLLGARVTSDLLPLLGIEPDIGRGFVDGEDEPDSEPVVILAHGFWRQSFAADLDVLGRTIDIDDVPHTIVGVLPADLELPTPDADYYLTMARGPRTRGTWFLHPVGRLADGISFEQAAARLEGRTVTVTGDERPEAVWGARLVPLHTELVGDVGPMLMLFMAAVSAVLLIASINVANLLLGRGARRSREHTVRAALGAGRLRLGQQVVTESTVLSLTGGAVGIPVAVLLTRFLVAASPASIPRQETIGVDVGAVLFAMVLAVAVGTVVGLIPALSASRIGSSGALRAVSASSARASQRFRDGLVVTQVALTLVLLVTAALLLRSFSGLLTIERGYDVEGILAFGTSLPASRYPGFPEKQRFQVEKLEALRALPGVRSAAVAGTLPFSGYSTWDYTVAGDDEPAGVAHVQVVSPGYFSTLGIDMLAGRDFTDRDGTGGRDTVIVNQSLARAHWPDGDAVGGRLQLESETWYEVIGVVADTRFIRLERDPMPQVYFPYASGNWRFNMVAFLRVEGDPLRLAGPAREAIAAIDDAVPVTAMGSLESRMWRSVAEPRFRSLLIGVFGGCALMLALVGVYGVTAYNVARRTHELGIRKALGADPRALLGSVLRRGAILAGLGAGIGCTGAWFAVTALESYLFGVAPRDPWTFALATAVLALAALAATLVPARRAASVDAVVALRVE